MAKTLKLAKYQQDALKTDTLHFLCNMIVGMYVPRSFIRKLSLAKRYQMWKYVDYVWAKANDNIVRRVERPSWFPKKYIYGRDFKGARRASGRKPARPGSSTKPRSGQARSKSRTRSLRSSK